MIFLENLVFTVSTLSARHFLEANIFLVRFDWLMMYQVHRTKDLNDLECPKERRRKRLFVGERTNLKTMLIIQHQNEGQRSYQVPLSGFYCGHLHYTVTRHVINAVMKDHDVKFRCKGIPDFPHLEGNSINCWLEYATSTRICIIHV